MHDPMANGRSRPASNLGGTSRLIATTILLGSSLSGCNNSDNNLVEQEASKPQNAAIEFAAVVGEQAFSCGSVYTGIGTGHSEYAPKDFRLYVSDVAMKTDTGEEIPVTLEQDGAWQYENVALLDFETGADAGCNGNAETNNHIVGTYEAPTAGNVVGMCFTLGIPFELNHLDTATSPSPLNASGMYWKWLSGHKFVRIDGTGDPNDATPVNFPIHLGSTGCTNDSGAMTDPATTCSYPNTPRICLDSFDMATQKVAVNAAALLAESNISDDTVNKGCMSGNNDPDCIPVMPKFGIDYVWADGVNDPVTYPGDDPQYFFTVAGK